ncbi:hypothetical protein CASFOL_032348 [Castilleja foliolosa]|uniref:ATP synthase CF0 subunit I n=1 Tax=Castilleja foliolosa TaxID=1961234 RepID=A0ABD3C1U3_9LAMI
MRTIAIKGGQADHILKTNMQRFVSGNSLGIDVKPLTDTESIMSSADISSRLFFFSVGSLFYFYENYKKEKDLKEKQVEFDSVKTQVDKLKVDVESLKEQAMKADIQAMKVDVLLLRAGIRREGRWRRSVLE